MINFMLKHVFFLFPFLNVHWKVIIQCIQPNYHSFASKYFFVMYDEKFQVGRVCVCGGGGGGAWLSNIS